MTVPSRTATSLHYLALCAALLTMPTLAATAGKLRARLEEEAKVRNPSR